MTEFNLLVETRTGPMLCNPRDQFIGTSLRVLGEFSSGERRLFAGFVRPGWTVFDCGANIGAHTVAFGQMVGPSGFVFAFEPQRIIYQTLCANIALNHLQNVHAFMVGLGREDGTIAVPSPDPANIENFGAVELGSTNGRHEIVPLLTLNSFAHLPKVHFLKMDIEGMEGDALAGAATLLERHRPLLYVENDRKTKAADLMVQLDELGYAMWWHQPPLFEPDNFNGVHESPWNMPYVSSNLICVPKEKATAMQPMITPMAEATV